MRTCLQKQQPVDVETDQIADYRRVSSGLDRGNRHDSDRLFIGFLKTDTFWNLEGTRRKKGKIDVMGILTEQLRSDNILTKNGFS